MKYYWISYVLIIFLNLFVACSREDTAVTFMIGGAPNEIAYWEKLIDEFEQVAGFEVRIIRQPAHSDQMRQGLVVPLHAHLNDPDVFLMDIVWIANFIRSGWLEPLNTYIEQNTFLLEPFFPAIIRSADSYHDTLFALPVYVDGGILYYRKDLLEKYGYSSPSDLWEEFLDCSQTIMHSEKKHNPNFRGYVWQGFQYEGLVCTFLEFAVSHGGGVTVQGDRIKVNTPENRKALTFMHDLIHHYNISPPSIFTEMKEEEVRLFFQNGDALFERNWPYAWNLHQSDNSPVRNKIGIASLPHVNGCSSASTLGGWHIGVSRFSDKKENAWELVRFITSYDGCKKLVLNLGWTPGRKDVFEDEEILENYPHFTALKEIYTTIVSRPHLPYYSRFSGVMKRYIHACLSGKISAEEALMKIDEKLSVMQEKYEK